MRNIRSEIIRIAWAQQPLLGADGDGEAAGHDDAAFLALMAQHLLAGISTGLIGLS